jgi:acyl-CoA reductase-like NAD-dependent aldehyde dehydrogenase
MIIDPDVKQNGNGAPRRTYLASYNPGTGEHITDVPIATQAEITQARKELQAASKVWKSKSVEERVRIVRQLQRVIVDSTDEITSVINVDTGKNRQFALGEVWVVADIIHRYTKYAPTWLRRRRISSDLHFMRKAFIDTTPYGVVAIISPWNYPFLLTIPPVVAALLAGNTVMLKPSEVTAATGQMIERLLARVPELRPFVRVLHGGPETGAALVASKPDLIFLTGSVGTGEKVTQAAARDMIPVITELGGKDPMIVLEDADLKAAAYWGTHGAYFNTGQSCVSIERAYVMESVYDEFVKEAVLATKQTFVGFSDDRNTICTVGPFSFEKQAQIAADQLQDAIDKGAKVEVGGRIEGMFMEPTVLTNVDHSMEIMQKETFGPILPIIKVKDEAEAIRLANDSEFGLSASVWSSDEARIMQIAQQLEVGSVAFNDTIVHFTLPRVPFGGVKKSGNGRIHGKADILQFTQTRSYIVGGVPHPLEFAYLGRDPENYDIMDRSIKLFFGTTVQQRLEAFRVNKEMKETIRSTGRIIAETAAVSVKPATVARAATFAVAATGAAVLATRVFRPKK